jgi:hypothetical protein
MANKKEPKGNIFNFIDDTASDPKLQKKMVDFINQKGKGWTGEKLLTEFHKLNYDGVSLRDCNKLLVNVKRVKDPSAWDWCY